MHLLPRGNSKIKNLKPPPLHTQLPLSYSTKSPTHTAPYFWQPKVNTTTTHTASRVLQPKITKDINMPPTKYHHQHTHTQPPMCYNLPSPASCVPNHHHDQHTPYNHQYHLTQSPPSSGLNCTLYTITSYHSHSNLLSTLVPRSRKKSAGKPGFESTGLNAQAGLHLEETPPSAIAFSQHLVTTISFIYLKIS